MVIREFGSSLERKYFNNRLAFPTSYLMLYTNHTLPTQIKKKYGDKIKHDFGIKRLTETEEINDKNEALKILSQASRMLSTKFQQNEQVKDAIIAYGFSRNVSGGLFLSIPTSITGVIIGAVTGENSLLLWDAIAAIIFCGLAFFHKSWIIQNAEKYAEKLISVYLADT